MKTYKERLVTGLKAIGYVEDFNDKSKYTAFRRNGTNQKVFVGANGALRVGECASRSHSIGDPSRQTAFYQSVLDRAPKEMHKGEVIEDIKEYLDNENI